MGRLPADMIPTKYSIHQGLIQPTLTPYIIDSIVFWWVRSEIQRRYKWQQAVNYQIISFTICFVLLLQKTWGVLLWNVGFNLLNISFVHCKEFKTWEMDWDCPQAFEVRE